MTSSLRFISLAALAVGSLQAQLTGVFRPTELTSAEEAALAPTFVAEARFGDRGGSAEYEYDLQTFPGLTTGQFAWQDNTATSFSLVYTALTQSLAFSVGGAPILTATTNGSDFGDIVLRARASGNSSVSTALSNLLLSVDGGAGQTISGSPALWAQASGNATGLLILDNVVSQSKNFSLTGDVTFDWSGTPTALRSNLAMQIKVGGEASAVPEPSTYGVMAAAGLLGLIAWRQRRRSA